MAHTGVESLECRKLVLVLLEELSKLEKEV